MEAREPWESKSKAYQKLNIRVVMEKVCTRGPLLSQRRSQAGVGFVFHDSSYTHWRSATSNRQNENVSGRKKTKNKDIARARQSGRRASGASSGDQTRS